MKRRLLISIICALIGLSQAAVSNAQPAASSAPGTGHGFLIDKHIAAALTCAKCHTESTAKAPDMPTCLSCHGNTYAQLATTTGKDQPNPHGSHRGEVPCADCHHVHMASVNACTKCHANFDMKVP